MVPVTVFAAGYQSFTASDLDATGIEVGQSSDIEVTAGTVSRVVNGILGTALAQSVLALIGFWVAGVPGAMLLGLLTFFLSIIPMGPPLVWLPAAIWLYVQGQTAWAIFLAIYGMVVISSIDNVVKPYLISRGGALPLLLGQGAGWESRQPIGIVIVFGVTISAILTLFIVPALYTLALSWFAYIQAHSDDYAALARLPLAEAALVRVKELDPTYREATVEHLLGVLNTVRPPALGGDFEAGQAHFRRAIEASGGRDLSAKVDYARYYARTLYDRELHDRLLGEVLAADPVQEGFTLFNTLAQQTAQELLDSADDYF